MGLCSHQLDCLAAVKGRGEVAGRGRLERREKEEGVGGGRSGEEGVGGGRSGEEGWGEEKAGIREGRRESWEGGGLTTTISKQSLVSQVETIVLVMV